MSKDGKRLLRTRVSGERYTREQRMVRVTLAPVRGSLLIRIRSAPPRRCDACSGVRGLPRQRLARTARLSRCGESDHGSSGESNAAHHIDRRSGRRGNHGSLLRFILGAEGEVRAMVGRRDSGGERKSQRARGAAGNRGRFVDRARSEHGDADPRCDGGPQPARSRCRPQRHPTPRRPPSRRSAKW